MVPFAIFCARWLVFGEALLAIAALAHRLPGKTRIFRRRWLVCSGLLVVLSLTAAFSLSAVYYSPRPFISEHKVALIRHAANNGFPSHHALLSAALVAMVALVDALLAVPFIFLAALVDWGRVACNVHHLSDVLASTAIVALAWLTSVAFVRFASARRAAARSRRRERSLEPSLERSVMAGFRETAAH